MIYNFHLQICSYEMPVHKWNVNKCLFQATDEQQVAIEKINNLLESFMGINDSELGKTVQTKTDNTF